MGTETGFDGKLYIGNKLIGRFIEGNIKYENLEAYNLVEFENPVTVACTFDIVSTWREDNKRRYAKRFYKVIPRRFKIENI